MISLFKHLAIIAALLIPLTAKAASFSENTHYSAEVLSTSPYRIQYTLKGETAFRPADFERLGIDGRATLVYALADKNVLGHADNVYIVSPNSYYWGYNPVVNTDPSHAISSILSSADTGFAFEFKGEDTGNLSMHATFIVELKPGYTYHPEQVHIQAVYLSQFGAPFIDVFQP